MAVLYINIIPIFFEILFSMYFICVSQLMFSSNNTPRNCTDSSVQPISLLFIFNIIYKNSEIFIVFFATFVEKRVFGFFHIK